MNLILERLLHMHRKNRLHHGFLMVGKNEELIQSTLAIFFEELLSSGQDPSLAALIKKKIGSLNHPDLFSLKVEGEIKIESIREMQKWLFVPPLEATLKIAFIPQAQKLNSSAANALLKTLEEPPSWATLILQATSSSQLLPTIRSRLFGIQFPDSVETKSEVQDWEHDFEKLMGSNLANTKDLFAFTESWSDQREELIYLFHRIYQTLATRMKDASHPEFVKLEKVFELTQSLESELYNSYGNISLGLDRLFLQWRNM